MIIRLNGKVLEPRVSLVEIKEVHAFSTFRSAFAAFATALAYPTATYIAANPVSGGMFTQFQPLFQFLAEVIGVIGCFAILGGIVVFVVRRRTGQKILTVAGAAIVAACLVPTAVLLLIIIGQYMNHAASEVLANMPK